MNVGVRNADTVKSRKTKCEEHNRQFPSNVFDIHLVSCTCNCLLEFHYFLVNIKIISMENGYEDSQVKH